MNLWKLLSIETITDIATYPVVRWLWDYVTPKVMDQAKKTSSEKRIEALAHISRIDPIAGETLERRLADRQFCRKKSYGPRPREHYIPGDEMDAAALIVAVEAGLAEASEITNREEYLVYLGRIKDEQFDVIVAIAKNDWLVQLMRRIGWYIDTYGIQKLKKNWPDIQKKLQTGDVWMGEQIHDFVDWLDTTFPADPPILQESWGKLAFGITLILGLIWALVTIYREFA